MNDGSLNGHAINSGTSTKAQTQSNLVEMLGDAEVAALVQVAWEQIFRVSGIVAHHAKTYGFIGMDMPDPNIHHMILAVRMVNSALETLLTDELLEYEEKRLLLNARKQATNLESLVVALQNNNRADFNEALACLNRQAAF